jgi:hypothetical protein
MLILIGAVTGLASVVITGAIAVLTLYQAHSESKSQRSQQYLLTILPRRLDALESIWRMVYELEAGESPSQMTISQLIEHSIWLPDVMRDEVIGLFVHPEEITKQDISGIRRKLLEASGSNQIDSLRSSLMDISIPDAKERHGTQNV